MKSKKNLERTREYQKQWRENNKDKIKAYKEKNQEKIREYQKEWREQNRETLLSYHKFYYKHIHKPRVYRKSKTLIDGKITKTA